MRLETPVRADVWPERANERPVRTPDWFVHADAQPVGIARSPVAAYGRPVGAIVLIVGTALSRVGTAGRASGRLRGAPWTAARPTREPAGRGGLAARFRSFAGRWS